MIDLRYSDHRFKRFVGHLTAYVLVGAGIVAAVFAMMGVFLGTIMLVEYLWPKVPNFMVVLFGLFGVLSLGAIAAAWSDSEYK